MSRTNKLAVLFSGALALAPLFGTSAFADWRHRDVTANDGRSQQRPQVRQDRGNIGRSAPLQQLGRREQWNGGDRNERDRNLRSVRGDNAYRYSEGRIADRRDDRFDARERQTFEGRVSRIDHDRDGYRVWVGGGAYPLFIPEARFRLNPLRVGLAVSLGGYWDPLGYYSVYNYSGRYYTSGELRGVVESVDYRSGTLVLRDRASGSFVTVELRGSDPRLGDLRRGDFVNLSGAWDRGGLFEASGVRDLNPRYVGY